MGRLRVFLALLIVDSILGTPGLGIETRTGGPAYVVWAYGIAFVALLAALALTWFAQRFAGPLATAAAVATVVLAVADILGLTGDTAAPAAVVAVDVAGVAIAAGIVWAAIGVRRRTASTA